MPSIQETKGEPMPISPAAAEQYAQEVRRLYAEAEQRMLAIVRKRLARGIDTDGWAEKKLREIVTLRREIDAELGQLSLFAPTLEAEVEAAYLQGSAEAIKDLAGAAVTDIDADLSAAQQLAVRELVKTAVTNVQGTHLPILRAVDDMFRRVVVEATEQAAAGTVTRRQAASIALNRFADRGVSTFVDRAGRHWDMASYAEMATRSATGQAAVQGHLDRLAANGKDLVMVLDSPEECALCRPYEGKVLSISGTDEQYPSMASARAAGLFHPNCTHGTMLYTPGLTRRSAHTANAGRYEDRQKQRYQERMIRRWKRREAVAMTDEDAAKAKARIKVWQQAQRELTAQSGLRRDYARESLTAAR